MEKKYYLREDGKNVSYSLEELLKKNLKKNTKIWIEGSSNWQRLDRIPELDIITNKIPTKRNNFFIFPIILVLIGGISYGLWFFYKQNKKPELGISFKSWGTRQKFLII